MRAADNGIPMPSLDLIQKCTENRQYYDKERNKREKENCNTYYHPSLSCVKMKHSYFLKEDIQVEESVRVTLLPAHLDLLQCVFDLDL